MHTWSTDLLSGRGVVIDLVRILDHNDSYEEQTMTIGQAQGVLNSRADVGQNTQHGTLVNGNMDDLTCGPIPGGFISQPRGYKFYWGTTYKVTGGHESPSKFRPCCNFDPV